MKQHDVKKLTSSKRDTAEAQDRIEAIEGIKRGLESMKRNAGKPAKDFFQEFFEEIGIRETNQSN